MKKVLLFIAGIAGLTVAVAQNTVVADKSFQQFEQGFINDLWKNNPGWASSVGYHAYDDVLTIPGKETNQSLLQFADATLKQLDAVKVAELSNSLRTDYYLIKNYAESTRFYINEFKEEEWNPAVFNVGDAVFTVLDNKDASLEMRMVALAKKLKAVPQYFEAAKKIINNPTFEHTQLAIEQNNGSLYLFDNVLPDSVKACKLAEGQKQELLTTITKAREAVKEYVSWLQELPAVKKQEGRSPRIGKQLYAKKFAYDINARYTADEMYAKAQDRVKYLQREMAGLTKTMWPTYFSGTPMPSDNREATKMMIDQLSKQHCAADRFLETIEAQLPVLEAFINKYNIIDLDASKPLKVRKTPEYMAGVAGASINSPGPYEKNGVTYYNVTPLTGYSEKEAESYLREYNNWVLQILNIHEAIPGHYTQHIYANRSPSIIQNVFGNGAMVEGWACYVERMMMEEGYDNSPEMWLFYYKWNLREACNFILDYNIHCNNWTEKDALDLLVTTAFQQEKEAQEKYRRVTLTQVQLTSYFTGLTEIYELRDEVKQAWGDQFTLKKFHEQFLSYGSAPVKEIRTMMLPAANSNTKAKEQPGKSAPAPYRQK